MKIIVIVGLIAGIIGLILCENAKTNKMVKVVALQIKQGRSKRGIRLYLQNEGYTNPEIEYILYKAERQTIL